ncbi:hypothetical protein [Rhizobium phage RHEph16]|uniref:Cadherin domain-containing protein n=1 Tax=Rhizobium phage RHEph16 TaxID=2836132 RepID=A0AAE8AWJ6_9CAUD|nr:hypothetical protein PP750_gp38 [Rhizobium phage RHEph16]QXV74347.1 hypothetical protein [Rhizobium phage RHEph16]
MSIYNVYWHVHNRICQVKLDSQFPPGNGYTHIGSFEHPEDDPLGPIENHVLYHHLRDIFYNIGEWNLQDMEIQRKTSTPDPEIVFSISTLPENTLIHSDVGVFSIVNGEEAFTFSKLEDPDNKFIVLPNGVFRLNQSLDYETKTSHSLTVKAENGSETFLTKTIEIPVTNVIEGVLGPSFGSYQTTDATNTEIVTITGLDDGANEVISSISPNDGRIAISNGNKLIKGASASSVGVLDVTVTTSAARVFHIFLSVTGSDEELTHLVLSDGSTFGYSGDQEPDLLGIHYATDEVFSNLPLLNTTNGDSLLVVRTSDGSRKVSLDDLMGLLES